MFHVCIRTMVDKSSRYPLEVSHLVKSYGSLKAVNDVSFHIEPGEIFGLLGPNGAGKTSIISTITTLEEPTSGHVKVFGHDVRKQTKLAKVNTGVVPQEIINHGYFTVEEILNFHSGYYGILKNTERIHFLLNKLQLWEHRAKKVKQLSGGMKRRLLIAKALVHSPKLLLLDEPTAGVDIELRASLWDFVCELKAEGMSILLTTHYLEEAEKLCDRVGILQSGVIKKVGPTGQLIKELTQRKVCFAFKDRVPEVNHDYLYEKTENKMTFSIPSNMELGQLLADLDIDLKSLVDVQIEEGSLEDAFVNILGGEAK